MKARIGEWFKPKKKAPHEVFPVILEWKEEDNVSLEGDKYIYLGCDGVDVILRSTEHPYEIKRISPRRLKWKGYVCENKSRDIRKANEDYFSAKAQLTESAYNNFLQLQFQQREQLFSQLLSGQLTI